MSLLNKVAYKMNPQENKEIRKQVQGLLDKGLIRESLSPFDTCSFNPKEGWEMEDVY